MQYLKFFDSFALLCCLLVQSSCTHKTTSQTTSNQSAVSLAASLYRPMSLEELGFRQTQFLEGMWDKANEEKMALPPGFDFEEAKNYVSQGLLPVFVPVPEGGWRVSEVRPSVVSQVLGTETRNRDMIPFLEHEVLNTFKNHQEHAEMSDYKKFAKQYVDKTKELYTKYPDKAQIRNMTVEAEPVSTLSQGQRILIYGTGPLNISSYLKFRKRIIGMYEMTEDGALNPYVKSFKLDEASVQLAKLFSSLRHEKIFDDVSLKMIVDRDGFAEIQMPSYYKNLDHRMNQEHCKNNDGFFSNWDVMEFLVRLNPDAQFVLVFGPEIHPKKDMENAGAIEKPFVKGSEMGSRIVHILKHFHINFMTKIPEFRPQLQESLVDYWTLKRILREMPDLLIFMPAHDATSTQFNVKNKIEKSLFGLHDLSRDGLILVSSTTQNMHRFKDGFFVDLLSNGVNEESFFLLDTASNIFYADIPTFFPLTCMTNLLVKFEYIVPLCYNISSKFFDSLKVHEEDFVMEIRKHNIFSPKGAVPLVLSYFNWLRQNGIGKTRSDIMNLFRRKSGVPVFTEIYRSKRYLGASPEVLE